VRGLGKGICSAKPFPHKVQRLGLEPRTFRLQTVGSTAAPGPPFTLATEAGANFISITGSTLTSKWFGDAEKLTKALFSFASRLAPVIIFVDEVDSLLGARGGAHEHEATRRMRNEFMAAWDGLRSKENQRILILGATNRPFDLDDAVIWRLPRRILVDLPDAKNRMKILKILLAKENLESDFRFDELANATEGYSGSDLKNLCIAAAYRPVHELLEQENKGDTGSTKTSLRALKLDDFVQAKAKVSSSVAFDATSMKELRKWNEQYGEGGSRSKSPFGLGSYHTPVVSFPTLFLERMSPNLVIGNQQQWLDVGSNLCSARSSPSG
jgi:hypothetical protein